MIKKIAVFNSILIFFGCLIRLLFFSGGLPPIEITDHSQGIADAQRIVKQCKESHNLGMKSWNPDYFTRMIPVLEKQPKSGDFSYLFYYYRSLFKYRLFIYHGMGRTDKEAIRYLDDAIENIERSIRLKNDYSESQAFYASLLGIKVGLKVHLALIYKRKMVRHLKKSLALDPENPRAHLIMGISKLSTPPLVGGDTDRAISEFKKAIELFNEKKSKPLSPTWGKEESYVWLGKAYKKKGDKEKAKYYLLKVLEINPNFHWAKQELVRGGLL